MHSRSRKSGQSDPQPSAVEAELQPRAVTDGDIQGVIETYRYHVFSLVMPILWRALLTPSSLWFRAALLPVFSFYLTYRPGSIAPWVVACATLAVVPLLVAAFILLQLLIIIRKATEQDLTEKLQFHFSDTGSAFFVVSAEGRVVGCVGVRNRTRGHAELLYLAVRPDLPNRADVSDALLEAVVAHARRASFTELVVKLNSAEALLVEAAKQAGLGNEQLIRINAWFHAHRLSMNLKKGR